MKSVPAESPLGYRSVVRRRTRAAAFALFLLFCLTGRGSACTEIAAGSRFWVRLTAPISSYTAKPGMAVHGFLLESPTCQDSAVFPIRIPVEGRVVSGHRVGLGLWHETATLELEFTRILAPDVPPVAIAARVMLVDNAREDVKNGVIHGVRSTDTPQGTISSRLKYMPSLHLYPDPFLLGYKLAFPIFPEPEIYLGAGTDLEVELTESAALPADLTMTTPVPLKNQSEIAEDLAGLPERTFTRNGKPADVVNMIFVGSRSELEQAFAATEWKQSDHVSRTTVRHSFYAFLAKTSYPTAPMSAQLLDNRSPAFTLEKTFDSYEKRDHLRIWSLPTGSDGVELWASAAVRETGATLSVRHRGFMHHVSPSLEEEQHIVVRDLVAADCVDSVGAISRPDMEHVLINATGEIFRTDGTLTVVHLKPCSSQASGVLDDHSFRPGSKLSRYARKEILTLRSDIWRANIIYGAFDLTRITARAWHQNSLHRAQVESFRQSNQTSVVSRDLPSLSPATEVRPTFSEPRIADEWTP